TAGGKSRKPKAVSICRGAKISSAPSNARTAASIKNKYRKSFSFISRSPFEQRYAADEDNAHGNRYDRNNNQEKPQENVQDADDRRCFDWFLRQLPCLILKSAQRTASSVPNSDKRYFALALRTK